MKRLLLILVLMLVSGFVASGQTMEEEVARVREQLGVSESTPIKLADSSNLPTANPLKVYLALGLDMEVRKRTIERKHGPGVPGQTLRDHFFDMLKHRNK